MSATRDGPLYDLPCSPYIVAKLRFMGPSPKSVNNIPHNRQDKIRHNTAYSGKTVLYF